MDVSRNVCFFWVCGSLGECYVSSFGCVCLSLTTLMDLHTPIIILVVWYSHRDWIMSRVWLPFQLSWYGISLSFVSDPILLHRRSSSCHVTHVDLVLHATLGWEDEKHVMLLHLQIHTRELNELVLHVGSGSSVYLEQLWGSPAAWNAWHRSCREQATDGGFRSRRRCSQRRQRRTTMPPASITHPFGRDHKSRPKYSNQPHQWWFENLCCC